MKLAITIMLAIGSIGLRSSASAADWMPVSSTDAVDQYFYDNSTLLIKEEEITYSKKVVFRLPQNMNGKEAASGIFRERLHCAERTIELVSYTYHSGTGEIIKSVAKDESESNLITPDSMGDVFERKLCPLVWQKQEEARIKAEQEAAETELSAIQQEGREVDPREESIPTEPVEKGTPVPPLPVPEIIEQLY